MRNQSLLVQKDNLANTQYQMIALLSMGCDQEDFLQRAKDLALRIL